MLTCPICKSKFNSLASHFRHKHRLTSQEVARKFPGLALVSNETKEKSSKTCKQLGIGGWRKGSTISEEAKLKKALKYPSSVIVGAVFEGSTVVELLDKVAISGRLRQRVRCQCSCGDFFETLDIYLWRIKNPRCKKCAKVDRQEYKRGDKIDKLTVLKYEGARKSVTCQCECGNLVRVRASSLSGNKTCNCGCSPRGHWRGVGNLSLTYYNRTKRGAVKRGFEFEVTIDYLWELYKGQGGRCDLTGIEIQLSKGKSQSASLDRIDSSKGYIEGNVQWVHKDVNLMKMNFSQEHFIELCQQVSAHTSQKTLQPVIRTDR